jgi:hypothetical protein
MGLSAFIGTGSSSIHFTPSGCTSSIFGHPRSPLSSTRLVKQAFFCDECPDERVREFETQEMAPYESMAWPARDLNRVCGSREDRTGCGVDKFLRTRVYGGLTTPRVGRRWREGCPDETGGHGEVGWLLRNAVRSAFGSVADNGDPQEGVRDGVEFRVVQGSGHHLMGDIYWEECAERILRFLE